MFEYVKPINENINEMENNSENLYKILYICITLHNWDYKHLRK